MLATFERRYRYDHKQEHAALLDAQGNLVAEHSGDFDSVEFTPQELERACLGILSHNHPRALAPSAADLALAAQYGLTIRAVGVTPEGEQVDYTVIMPVPSLQVADAVKVSFDDEVEQAEKDLSAKPMDDRTWERESRNLAVTRLAKRFNFQYQRVFRDTPISEATRHEVKRLNVLDDVETTMHREWLSPLHAGIVRLLNHHADPKGHISVIQLDLIRQIVAGMVVRSMLGKPDANGTLEPYRVQHGVVMPNSPYFKALWGLMVHSATVAVERQAAIMRRYLPADLIRLFESAVISPFGQNVQEIAEYDPLHLWLGPDGKRLSDRIWIATGDMRRKLDAYLADAIARNVPVTQMAKELEVFLQPGNGPYEAMRLARTEVAAAHSRAESAAAQMNPLVETYSPFTAPKHACCDGCDLEEQQGPYPKSDTTHLPPFHPNCICGVMWNVVKDIKGTIAKLRQQVEQAIAQAKRAFTDWIGPLSKQFVSLLFRGRP